MTLMSWYAAHIVMAVKLKMGGQTQLPVWENIVLIESDSEQKAFAKAESIGRQEEGDDEGSFRWGGRPATWIFAGVRKLTECPTVDARPGDGSEITYNELEFDSLQALEQYVAGEPTPLRSNDRFRPLKGPRTRATTRRATRKRA
jgi:hypothetical protein